jgi:mannose-1-phosphate guanylyltransferase
MRHAVIMAGGAGTRLWPLSRRMRPKQLLRLFDGASLLQLVRRRLAGLFAPENIWVVTSAAYLDQVAEQLPDVPRDNLIGEPMGRDTANAIGLAAHLLVRRDRDATMAVFTADHIIQPQTRFAAAIQAGLEAVERFPQSLVTFGITPQSPHTGYGYLHRGELVAPGTWRVAEFKEKPTLETARAYLASGEYYWNSGMFVWRVEAILAELERLLPENARALKRLATDWERVAGTPAAAAAFAQLRRISIDFGVMEHARSVLLVEMTCDWKDLGSWASVASTRTADEAGNVTIAPRAMIVDGRQNVVISEAEHLVVLLGVDDLVVVHSEDATLVCRRHEVERVKDLVERRRKPFGDQYE